MAKGSNSKKGQHHKKSSNLVVVLICLIAVALIMATVIIVLVVTRGEEGSDRNDPTFVLSDGKDENRSDCNDENYNIDSIIGANSKNGCIADHVKGGKNAKVVIVEYADYQCPGCAMINTWVNALVKEYDGKIALVYRSFLLSYHKNARPAAKAAEAAGLQGYWKEFTDFLFANQSEWEYLSSQKLTDYFVDTFKEVSDWEGDVDKFKTDMESDEVSAKIDFDIKLGKKVKVAATPSFYMDGEVIEWYDNSTRDLFMNFMRDLIDEKLAK